MSEYTINLHGGPRNGESEKVIDPWPRTQLIVDDLKGGSATYYVREAEPEQADWVENPTEDGIPSSAPYGAVGPTGPQGPVGETGPPGPEGKPGVGISYKGVYNKEVTYKLNEAVTEGDAFFISLVEPNLNHDPQTDGGVHWERSLSGLNPRGLYNAETLYNLMDSVVASNGNAYVCLINGTIGIEPAADVEAKGGHWILLALGGKEGKEGPKGVEGKEGPKGVEGKEGKAGPSGSAFTIEIGDGVKTEYLIEHKLGTQHVVTNVYEKAVPHSEITTDVRITDENHVTLVFGFPPSENQYVVVVVSGGSGGGGGGEHKESYVATAEMATGEKGTEPAIMPTPDRVKVTVPAGGAMAYISASVVGRNPGVGYGFCYIYIDGVSVKTAKGLNSYAHPGGAYRQSVWDGGTFRGATEEEEHWPQNSTSEVEVPTAAHGVGAVWLAEGEHTIELRMANEDRVNGSFRERRLSVFIP